MTSIPLVQPDLYIFGLRLQEPMTTLTDVLITVVCVYAFMRLRKIESKNKSTQLVQYYFLFMGIGILIGGLLGHGFKYAFGDEWKIFGWLTSMVGVFFMERSTIVQVENMFTPKWHQLLLRLNFLELAVLMSLLISTYNFKIVQLHAFIGFIFMVFPFHLFLFFKTNHAGSRYMILGIGTLVLSLLTFGYPIAPHQWFNHNDLSHVLIAAATYLLMRGALEFETTADNKIQSNQIFKK